MLPWLTWFTKPHLKHFSDLYSADMFAIAIHFADLILPFFFWATSALSVEWNAQEVLLSKLLLIHQKHVFIIPRFWQVGYHQSIICTELPLSLHGQGFQHFDASLSFIYALIYTFFELFRIPEEAGLLVINKIAKMSYPCSEFCPGKILDLLLEIVVKAIVNASNKVLF